MAFRKKINKHIDNVISQGAPVVADIESAKWKIISLRITTKMLEQVDAEIEQHRVGLTRNAWLLEAIQEKLSK